MHLVWRSLPSSARAGYARERSSAALDTAYACASLPLDAYERVYSHERIGAIFLSVVQKLVKQNPVSLKGQRIESLAWSVSESVRGQQSTRLPAADCRCFHDLSYFCPQRHVVGVEALQCYFAARPARFTRMRYIHSYS